MTSDQHTNSVELCEFIDSSPSPYHTVATSADLLQAAGFTELRESEPWLDVTGPRFMRRGGSLVAWLDRHGGNTKSFALVGAHTDSPNLRVKPHPDIGMAGFAQVGVEVYGGVLLNSWLDRDLGVSGRLVVEDSKHFREVLVAVHEPILRIPQLAIHLDRDYNERGLKLNKQLHMAPVWADGKAIEGAFLASICAHAQVEPALVRGADLMLHALTPARVIGHDNQWLAAPRIDNLASCFAAVSALAKSADSDPGAAATPVVCLFDHEEVGSVSASGAAGSLLPAVLGRIATTARFDLHAVLADSACISADGAHATHPNYADRHEPSHHVSLNAGPVIKHNSNERYSTNALGHAIAERACRDAGVPYQHFVSRSDLACGSTIGPVTSAQLGVTTVDVGIPQLSMHSANEMCGVDDPHHFGAMLEAFLGR